MKKKLFALALLTATTASFAAPVSTPNTVNDTPIVSSGGGTVGGSGQCQAYQTDGAVNLSGGETLVFYGGANPYIHSVGGYLSTKTTYSGTAYVKTKYYGSYDLCIDRIGGCEYYSGKAIGLFARDSNSQSDFIAGAGASSGMVANGAIDPGGGWQTRNASIYSGNGFFDNTPPDPWWVTRYKKLAGIGFFNGLYSASSYRVAVGGGGASSISAFYNYYTKRYTSLGLSYTITGGGSPAEPILYVCK